MSNIHNPIAAYMTIGEAMVGAIDAIQKDKQSETMKKVKRLLMTDRLKLQKLMKQSNTEIDRLELAYFDLGNLAEVICEVMTTKPPEITIALLQAYLDGKIGIMDENKHSKILKQIPTV